MEELILKFGDVKGGDFSNNPKALEAFNKRKDCVTDEDYKKNALEVIELWDGDFFIWWGQIKCDKEEAKKYIREYKPFP